MPCKRPRLRVEELGKWQKAKDGHLYHPAKIFSSDNLEAYDYMNSGYTKITPINCTKCIECRLDYSRQWANRGYLEQQTSENAWFITLTHNDKSLYTPEEMTTSKGITYVNDGNWKGCLEKDKIKKFMHDLRQEFDRKQNYNGIRFMGCGEYGTEGQRSHYHLIVYNLPLPIESFYNTHLNWEKNYEYNNEILDKVWHNQGIVKITEANWQTIAYVARYITKKQYGKESEDYYASRGQIPEYFVTSRRPGIGYDYYQEHKDEIYKNDSILIMHGKKPQWVKPPKYYDDMYKIENPEHFEEIQRKRQKEQLNNLKEKATKTSLTRWEQFQIELATKETKTKVLYRNKV